MVLSACTGNGRGVLEMWRRIRTDAPLRFLPDHPDHHTCGTSATPCATEMVMIKKIQ